MITKMQEESWLRTDAANERGKRVPLFGGCIAKGLQARSGAYIRQGEAICEHSFSSCFGRERIPQETSLERNKCVTGQTKDERNTQQV